MDEATRRTLRAIEDAVARKPPEGPVVLSQEYLRLVERVEALPQNQSGADKTWVERMIAQSKYELETAREVRPE